MSLYAVKNADGKYINYIGEYNDESPVTAVYQDSDRAHIVAHAKFGRVVELVEKAEPVEVVEKQRNLLYQLDEALEYDASSKYAGKLFKQLHRDADMSCADIFRALDFGWTVKQPKRWYVKTPKEWGSRGEGERFYKRFGDSIGTVEENHADNTADEQFTAEEIERYRLGGFEKVGVED